MTRQPHLILVAFLCYAIISCSPLKPKAMSKNNPTNAEQNALTYIETFKQGKSYSPPPRGISAEQNLDTGALKILTEYLLSENSEVRENIVSLMADASMRVDPDYAKGIAILREKAVLNSLVKSGLVKPDAGRERAADLLRNYCRAIDLKPFAKHILDALAVRCSDEMLLLVAKVKPENAEQVINAIATDPYWKTSMSFRIAQAALGNQEAYQQLLNAVHKAIEDKNTEAFAEAVNNLGKTGTPLALREVALQLRTPLIQEMPGVFRKSARLDVLNSLIYNFPDIVLFNQNMINTDDDYIAAENYCINEFGIEYKDARPSFLTYHGYGHPK